MAGQTCRSLVLINENLLIKRSTMSTLSSPLLLADKALHSPMVLPPSATQVHRACPMLMRSHFDQQQRLTVITWKT
ncbi:unnamed protein product [Pleuronectes platessa]|uniref:Uncharacterized protein n=1 Tax=Pleuronectes platessa TaxID=8262 RepID=A0A9N7TLT6_PLEPL|nr:unnamed protein product [Pleuronectes platessa]